MSLRKRLTLLTVGAFSVGLLVLGYVVPSLVRNFLTQRLDQDLQRTRFRAGQVFFAAQIDPGANRGPTRQVNTSESYFELRTADGTLLRAAWSDPAIATTLSPPKLPATLAGNLDHAFTVDSTTGKVPAHWRVVLFAPSEIGATITSNGTPVNGFLVAAMPMSSVDATVSETFRVVAIAAISTLVAVGLLTYMLVGFGLRPLRRMQRSAAGISSAGDLHQRVEQPSEKTELGQLGSTLNGMLGRLETSFEEQQQNQARLRRFVSDASHELRTPLTSIRGYAELHRRGYKDVQQVDRSMDRIEQESARMSRLVEDLLALARADEKRTITQAPVDLREMVSGLVDDLRVVHPDRRINADLGKCRVMGDGALLAQSVVNVLANAGVHTPPGTPIDVVLRAEGESAVLTIADHGIGIDPVDAGHVFDRFYRSDVSRNRESGGSGLGLSITAAIVEAHGGTISTSPTLGGGATFTITLPLIADRDTTEVRPPGPASPWAAPSDPMPAGAAAAVPTSDATPSGVTATVGPPSTGTASDGPALAGAMGQDGLVVPSRP